MSENDLIARIQALPIWKGRITATPLTGGITNVNYRVTDDPATYVVRVGDDIPLHQVLRFNELSAARAAHAEHHNTRLQLGLARRRQCNSHRTHRPPQIC